MRREMPTRHLIRHRLLREPGCRYARARVSVRGATGGFTMKWEATSFPNAEEMSRAAAHLVAETALSCIRAKGLFTLVLSGGSSPRMLYERLGGPVYRDAIPWDRVHFFWGDERCVPYNHPESNYGTAYETLIGKLPEQHRNINRIPGDMHPPESAAEAYEHRIMDFFIKPLDEDADIMEFCDAEGMPSFDMVLLGMGSDGHTASLFPDSEALDEQERWAVAVEHPNADPPVPRVTMTLPILNASKYILFLISGKEKRPILKAVLENPLKAAKLYPSAMINPRGRLMVYHDVW